MKTVLLFVTALFLMISLNVNAIPASPYPIDVKQPNGEIVTIMLKGDERFSWQTTIDGYTLMYNKDGYLTYAIKDAGGNLQASAVIATQIEKRNAITNSFLNDLAKGLFYSHEQVSIMTQVSDYKQQRLIEIKEQMKTKKSDDDESGDHVIGNYKTICALVQFPELSFIKTTNDFESLMNQLNYSDNGAVGSVRDFFKTSSYDQFDLHVTLVGPYTAPKSEMYYTGDNKKFDNCPELAQFVLDEVNKTIDFSEYDSNEDEIVDGFHFIFAGYCQAAGAPAGTIWSHKHIFQGVINTGKYVQVDNKYIAEYSCSPELRDNQGTDITYIGVIAHEMSHAFGAPDFYDTNYDADGEYMGTGLWDIMAHGSWNDRGSRPAHHNMYQKIRYGWVKPVELSSQTSITDMPNSAENPVAYIVNTKTNNEYFILENRQQVNFDLSIPGHGLLIYRVSSDIELYFSSNDINATHRQHMYPVCASAEYEIPYNDPMSYGNVNSKLCTFSDANGYTSFTDNTKPSTKSWNGKYTLKPITNIRESNSKINFDFMESDVPDEKYNVEIKTPIYGTLEVNDGTTTLESGDLVKAGTKLTMIATPDNGYKLAAIEVNYMEIVGNTAAIDGPTTISAIFEVDPNGINNLESMRLKIYPNPVFDVLNIEGKYTKLDVYNTLGELILTKVGEAKINLRSLTAGIYFIKIYNDGEVHNIRIVKN